MTQIKGDLQKFLSTNSAFKKLLIASGAILILVFSFQLGVYVKQHKTLPMHLFGGNDRSTDEKYNERGMMMGRVRGGDFANVHGLVGKILSAENGVLVVRDRDGTEKTVVTSSDTQIRLYRDEITFADLGVGEYVIVIGDTTDTGDITAKIVRILPQMESLPENFRGMMGTGTPTANPR